MRSLPLTLVTSRNKAGFRLAHSMSDLRVNSNVTPSLVVLPTLIHFAPDVPGEPLIESLPIAEFYSRAVRLALKKYRVEEVEVIR